MNNENSFPQQPEELRQRAHEHTRAAANLMGQLAALAAINAGQFETDDAARSANEAMEAAEVAKKQELDRATHERMVSFFGRLPSGNRLTGGIDSNWRSGMVKARDIQESLLLDALLVWVPTTSNPYAGSPLTDPNIAPLWTGPTTKRGLLEADKLTMRPAYIIGRNQYWANDSKTDAVDGILLFPAFRDPKVAKGIPPILQMKASSRQLDRLEELSLERLAKPIGRTTYDAHKDEGGFSATAVTSIRRVSPKANPNLSFDIRNRLSDDMESRAVKRMTAKLLEEGLRVGGSHGEIMLGPEMIERYSVASYALRLATLFGQEDAYSTTF